MGNCYTNCGHNPGADLDFVAVSIYSEDCFYIYDGRMLKHDDKKDFIEKPLRIKNIFEHLRSQNLLDCFTPIPITESETKSVDGENRYPLLETVHSLE